MFCGAFHEAVVTLEHDGYELRERRGPIHQPVFVVVAWALLAAGSRVAAEPCEASSKKDAEHASADRLLSRLADEGVVGRRA